MSDEDQDDSQKTEEPTPKRLQEMRDQGQVVMSREINSWVMLFAGSLILIILGPWLMYGLVDIMKVFIASPHRFAMDSASVFQMAVEVSKEVGFYLLLPVIILILAAFFAPFAQIGALLSTEPIIPKLEKISPIAGFSRVFGMKALFEFFKGLVKIVLIGLVIFFLLQPFMDTVTIHIGQTMEYMMVHIVDLMTDILIAVLAVLFVLSVLDYLYQRYEFLEKAKMSLKEIKDEYKQTEGDPHVKARLRQLRHERARTRMMDAVPEADVVITNPTHFAVALKYSPEEMNAPRMVAKGQDFIALKIREMAQEHKIEILENPPLARALYAGMEIDQEIPPEHYKAVANVIKYVFEKKGKKL